MTDAVCPHCQQTAVDHGDRETPSEWSQGIFACDNDDCNVELFTVDRHP